MKRLILEDGLEIYHLSSSSLFIEIYRYHSRYFSYFLLEYGFMQLIKKIEINEDVFFEILDNYENIDMYIFSEIKNTDDFRIFRKVGFKFSVYNIGNDFFFDTWSDENTPLLGKRVAKRMECI